MILINIFTILKISKQTKMQIEKQQLVYVLYFTEELGKLKIYERKWIDILIKKIFMPA
jgi:hypothetical protein